MKTKSNSLNDKKVHFGSRKYIDPDEVYLLESDINYTQIYLRSGEKILSSTTLKKIEKRLASFSEFVRVNRQSVVNMKWVISNEKEACLLPNKKMVFYSRRMAKIVFDGELTSNAAI
ncbi:MAG: LytTR family transcriptional regulator DNA-binding domain-containing protein [Leadbetterella sp.]